MTDDRSVPHRRPSPEEAIDAGGLRKAFVAALAGTSLEWYDFAVYSAASALVLPVLFFPAADQFTATLLAFSTYAVGYVSRPVGGIVFGRLGDIVGRKRVLVITLLLIGVSTFLIGVLPTYVDVGGVAALLLVLLRFAQGVGVGGEWGGAVLLSSEFGDPRRRGLWASAAQIGPPAGNLLANGALAVLTATLSADAFLQWGWRVAFLLSALLVAFGLWIRLKLEDTPVFQALESRGDRSEAPVKEVFTTQLRPLISAILSRLGPDVLYALLTVFSLTYAVQHLGLSRNAALLAVLGGSAFQLVTIPLAGWLSDKIRRRTLYAVATAGTLVFSFLFFLILRPGSEGLLLIALIIGLTFHSFMYGPQAAYVIEQFHPRLRYTGASLAYTIAGVFGGALAPFMFTLISGNAAIWWPVAVYVAAACALTLVGLAMGREGNITEDEAYLQQYAEDQQHTPHL